MLSVILAGYLTTILDKIVRLQSNWSVSELFSKHSQQMLSGAEVGTLGRPFQRLIANLLYLF